MSSRKPDKTSVEDWLSSKLDDELGGDRELTDDPDSMEPPTRPLTAPRVSGPRPAPRKRTAPRKAPPAPPRPAPTVASTSSQDTDPPSPPPPPMTSADLPSSWAEVDEDDPPTERLEVVHEARPSPSPLPVQAGPAVSPEEEDNERKTRPLPAPEDHELTSSVARAGRPGVPSYTGGLEPGRLAGVLPPRPQPRQVTRPKDPSPSPEGAVPRVAPLGDARPPSPTWAVDPEEDVEDAPTVFTVSTRIPDLMDPGDSPIPFEGNDLDRGDTVSILADLGAGIAVPSSPELTPVVAPRRPDVPDDPLPVPLSSLPEDLPSVSDIPEPFPLPEEEEENIHDAPTVAASAMPDLSMSSPPGASHHYESADPTRQPPALIAWMALGIVLLLTLLVVGLLAAILVGMVGP